MAGTIPRPATARAGVPRGRSGRRRSRGGDRRHATLAGARRVGGGRLKGDGGTERHRAVGGCDVRRAGAGRRRRDDREGTCADDRTGAALQRDPHPRRRRHGRALDGDPAGARDRPRPRRLRRLRPVRDGLERRSVAHASRPVRPGGDRGDAPLRSRHDPRAERADRRPPGVARHARPPARAAPGAGGGAHGGDRPRGHRGGASTPPRAPCAGPGGAPGAPGEPCRDRPGGAERNDPARAPHGGGVDRACPARASTAPSTRRWRCSPGRPSSCSRSSSRPRRSCSSPSPSG